MGILTTACAKLSHSAFKYAIETASELESVFENINQKMRIQYLKMTIYTGTNKVACDPFTLCNSYFSIIISNILTYAIDRIKSLLVEIQENSTKYNKATTYLLSSSLELLDTNPTFYKVFLKAEDTFCQLLDNASIKTEFIACINQTVTMLLFKPLKASKIEVLKGYYLGTKHEKLLSEKQDVEAKKKK
ncbi:19479_t:CDS:2, partial [Cetraspora pellucida]